MKVTRKFRIMVSKDYKRHLDEMAAKVNFVWNYCVELMSTDRKKQLGSLSGIFHQPTRQEEVEVTEDGKTKKKKAWTLKRKIHIARDQILDLEVGDYLSGYDLQKFCAGASKELGLPSATISLICDEVAKSYVQKAILLSKKDKKATKAKKGKKARPKRVAMAADGSAIVIFPIPSFLRFRSNKRSRPWIPMKGASMHFDHSTEILKFNGLNFKVWVEPHRKISGKIADGKLIKEGGKWYVSVCVDLEPGDFRKVGTGAVGIDLGLKTFATLSTGEKIDNPLEPTVSFWGKSGTITEMISRLQSFRDKTASERKKKKISEAMLRFEAIATESRKHFHFGILNTLLDRFGEVYIGDLGGKFIQASAGKKSKALSIGLFKSRAEWIAKRRGRQIIMVDESHTTVTCGNCLERTGPSGAEDLDVREWVCAKCGTQHDRDVNAAQNILRRGLSLRPGLG